MKYYYKVTSSFYSESLFITQAEIMIINIFIHKLAKLSEMKKTIAANNNDKLKRYGIKMLNDQVVLLVVGGRMLL